MSTHPDQKLEKEKHFLYNPTNIIKYYINIHINYNLILAKKSYLTSEIFKESKTVKVNEANANKEMIQKDVKTSSKKFGNFIMSMTSSSRV